MHQSRAPVYRPIRPRAQYESSQEERARQEAEALAAEYARAKFDLQRMLYTA